MIITLPFICCYSSDSKIRTTSVHWTQHQNTHRLNLRGDGLVRLQSKQCVNWDWETTTTKGKHNVSNVCNKTIHLCNRSEPLSPRHHGSNNHSSEALSNMMQNPMPSMILRDTSIREQFANKDSSSLNTHSGYTSSTFSSRERDNSSAFLSSTCNNLAPSNNLLSSLAQRESTPILSASRTGSNRFLSGGLDQRIIKQSSEDCRRLLQQVS